MEVLHLLLLASSSLASLVPQAASGHLGPYKGLPTRSSPQNPSCVWFALQDNLPAGTVQIITYGAPEVSAYLAMSLAGDQSTFPQPGQTVTAHYVLHLDDCTFIESSRDNGGEPFSFQVGTGMVIAGWDAAVPEMSLGQRAVVTLSPDMAYGEEGAGDGVIPPNATLIFDIEIINIE